MCTIMNSDDLLDIASVLINHWRGILQGGWCVVVMAMVVMM